MSDRASISQRPYGQFLAPTSPFAPLSSKAVGRLLEGGGVSEERTPPRRPSTRPAGTSVGSGT
jgi:hypothetical protein